MKDSLSLLMETERAGGWMIAASEGFSSLEWLADEACFDASALPRTAAARALVLALNGMDAEAARLVRLLPGRVAGDEEWPLERSVVEGLVPLFLNHGVNECLIRGLVSAAAMAPSETALQAIALSATCHAQLAGGRFRESRELAGRAADLCDRRGLADAALSSLIVAGLADWRLGNLEGARSQLQNAIERGRRLARPSMAEAAEFFLRQVEHDLALAPGDGERPPFAALFRRDRWGRAGVGAYLVAVTRLFQFGRQKRAFEALDEAEDAAIARGSQWLRALISCRRRYLQLTNGIVEATEWHGQVSSGALDGLWHDDALACQALTWCAHWLVTGRKEDTGEVVALVEAWLADPAGRENVPVRARLLCFLVALQDFAGGPESVRPGSIAELHDTIVQRRYLGALIDCAPFVSAALERSSRARLAPNGVRILAGELVATLAKVTPNAVRTATAAEPSKRQEEVLRLLVEGLSNHQIGRSLRLNVGTVSSYRRNLYRRLQVRTRADAVQWFLARREADPAGRLARRAELLCQRLQDPEAAARSPSDSFDWTAAASPPRRQSAHRDPGTARILAKLDRRCRVHAPPATFRIDAWRDKVLAQARHDPSVEKRASVALCRLYEINGAFERAREVALRGTALCRGPEDTSILLRLRLHLLAIEIRRGAAGKAAESLHALLASFVPILQANPRLDAFATAVTLAGLRDRSAAGSALRPNEIMAVALAAADLHAAPSAQVMTSIEVLLTELLAEIVILARDSGIARIARVAAHLRLAALRLLSATLRPQCNHDSCSWQAYRLARLLRWIATFSGESAFLSLVRAQMLACAESRVRRAPTGDPGASRRIAAVRGISRRQQEVLELVSRGLANKQIAGALALSEETVKSYRKALYRRLGISSRAGAVAALRNSGAGPLGRAHDQGSCAPELKSAGTKGSAGNATVLHVQADGVSHAPPRSAPATGQRLPVSLG